MNSFFVHLSVLVCVMCITAQQSKLASEFITQSFTDSDFLSWTFTGASIPATHQFTTCNGNLLFGGIVKDMQVTTCLSVTAATLTA